MTQLLLHRSGLVGQNGETEESLASTFDATLAWQILYKRNSAGWADVLTARLSATEAHTFAGRLRRHIRAKSKRGPFRDHRHVYSRSDAAHLALLIAWLERAGAAGCAVWSDLASAVDMSIAPGALEDSDTTTEPVAVDTNGNDAHASISARPAARHTPEDNVTSMHEGRLDGQRAPGIMPEWMPEELKDTAWGQGQ